MRNTFTAKILGLSVLLFSALSVSGQSEQQNTKKPEGAFAPFIDALIGSQDAPKPATKKVEPQNKVSSQSSPETQDKIRERKVGEARESASPLPNLQQKPVVTATPSLQQVPPYYPQEVPLPSGTDEFLLEQQRHTQKLERQQRQQDALIQKQYEDFQKRQQVLGETEQSVIVQPQQEIPQIFDPTKQQNLEQNNEKEKQDVLTAKNLWKSPFGWLVLLFEIALTVGLSVLAFKTGHGKKAVKVMLIAITVAGIVFLAVRVFAAMQGETEQNQGNLIVGGVIGFTLILFSFYAFVGGKIAAIIGLCMMPSQTWQRLCAVLSFGIAYTAFYLWLIDFMMHSGAVAQQITTPASIQGIITGAAVTLIGLIVGLAKSGKSHNDDFHGSARFAERKEFKELENPLEAGGFILAPAHPKAEHGKLALPRRLSVMHGLILGGSGTGKSRGYFMANCAEGNDTSVVVTDPKSELWKYTSGFHSKSMRFAPAEPEASFCFNWIPLCTDARMAELCARAIMTAGSTKNTDQFWIDAETAFLSAVFAHAAMTTLPTPLTAYRLFTKQTPDELMKQLLNSPSPVAREQAIIFNQTDTRIKGAIVPAIAARMQFMRDGAIQLFTSAHTEAPNFGQLRHSPTAVYWCLREQDIARLRPLTSLFFTVLLEQLAGESVPEDEGEVVPVTMFLDEFANIGKIPDFETTISLARGRGVSLWLGVQSLSQINQTYGDHAAQTIMSNCATKIALHGLDFQTAEYVSRMLGEKTIVHNRNSFNFGMTGVSVGSSGAEHRRQLLTPDEVMRIGENEALVRVSNKYPMRLYKGYYNEPVKTAPVAQTLTRVQAVDVAAEDEVVTI